MTLKTFGVQTLRLSTVRLTYRWPCWCKHCVHADDPNSSGVHSTATRDAIIIQSCRVDTTGAAAHRVRTGDSGSRFMTSSEQCQAWHRFSRCTARQSLSVRCVATPTFQEWFSARQVLAAALCAQMTQCMQIIRREADCLPARRLCPNTDYYSMNANFVRLRAGSRHGERCQRGHACASAQLRQSAVLHSTRPGHARGRHSSPVCHQYLWRQAGGEWRAQEVTGSSRCSRAGTLLPLDTNACTAASTPFTQGRACRQSDNLHADSLHICISAMWVGRCCAMTRSRQLAATAVAE